MPGQAALHKILNLQIDQDAPVFIIYADQNSKRLQYTCEFIFNHVLKVNFQITSDFPEWENSDYYKICYSENHTGKDLQVIPDGLLSEKKINEKKPEPFFKNDIFYFYENLKEERSALHFDIFSAVFYFISRYEEWQTFDRDAHGRFEIKQSVLYNYHQHLKPVVDHWIYELKSILEITFPNLIFPNVSFKAISTIDVDNLFAYRGKNFLRTAGACIKDILKLDFKNLSQRVQVLSGNKKDPFDIYQQVCKFCNEQEIELIFFFLFRCGTKYDRTVDPESQAFKNVFAILKKYNVVAGLHPSYDSVFKTELLKKEIQNFSSKWGEKINLSRQHFLRFDIKTTPKLLIEQGIQLDFSMGFASSVGFRAGTSQPFFYYDFNAEEKKDLLFVPFCAMDGAYFIYEAITPEKALTSLLNLATEVKKVNGLFITVFHERTFSNHLYKGFDTLYKNLHLKLKAFS